jgi:DnaJ like chaperone protein
VPPKRPSHTVLGVRPAATPDEVTAAYRELAQLYHPDKVASLAPEFRELAELRMKEINAAYREMTKKA